MEKKHQAQHDPVDQALKRGLLWVAGAIVLEVLLFLVNRYAINFDSTAAGVALAGGLRTLLKALRIAGAVAFVGGGVLAVIRAGKEICAAWTAVLSVMGAVIGLCAHVALQYHGSGMRMLYLLVPVLGGVALAYYLYPRDFVVGAVPVVIAALGLWFYRMSGFGPELILTIVAAVVMLVGVLLLKKGDGNLKLGELSLRVLPAKSAYAMPVASGAIAVALQLLAVVAGGVVAYYLIFFAGAWLFALLVYDTVKLL